MTLSEILLIVLIVLVVISITILILLLVKKKSSANNINKEYLDNSLKNNKNEIEHDFKEENYYLKQDIKNIKESIDSFSLTFNKEIRDDIDKLNKDINDLNKKNIDELKENIKSVNDSLNSIKNEINSEFKSIFNLLDSNNEKTNTSIKVGLKEIKDENTTKLNEIKGVVDEKLEKTLEDKLSNSFKNVINQMDSLNKTVGQIQTLAGDVSSLKVVLANTKTKGIVGEIVLGNLIKDLLAPSQYEENVITKIGTQNRVEFAIILPGTKNEKIYLPIDSKFPTESYNRILDASNNADKEALDKARKELERNIKENAKDINNKYIDVPNTTQFGIMFLPNEGLYAEVINLNLFEKIQNEYNVIITGPSTFSALLNALQMGFKTLAIQKKSNEVFKLLGAIKTEFSNFTNVLASTQKSINKAGSDLETLVGTRTRAINKKLENVQELSIESANEILKDIDENN